MVERPDNDASLEVLTLHEAIRPCLTSLIRCRNNEVLEGRVFETVYSGEQAYFKDHRIFLLVDQAQRQLLSSQRSILTLQSLANLRHWLLIWVVVFLGEMLFARLLMSFKWSRKQKSSIEVDGFSSANDDVMEIE